jgi:hypothetical protein
MIDRSRVLCACIAHLWSRSYVKGSRSVVEEITSICADFPVADAVRPNWSPIRENPWPQAILQGNHPKLVFRQTSLAR